LLSAWSLAAAEALGSDSATPMQLMSLNERIISSQSIQDKAVLLNGEMAEWLKAAVC
jgi:hypothetical protein